MLQTDLKDKKPKIFTKQITDPFLKRHKLVHNGGFPTFEELYCNLIMVILTEISSSLSYKVQSSNQEV